MIYEGFKVYKKEDELLEELPAILYREGDTIVAQVPEGVQEVEFREVETGQVIGTSPNIDGKAIIEYRKPGSRFTIRVGDETITKLNQLVIDDTDTPKEKKTLDDIKQDKINELKRQCEAAITGGYQSTVVLASTGVAHIYPTARDDQTNLNASATAAQLKPAGTPIEFKTKDAGYVMHTQDEIKAVSLEVYEFVLGNLKRVDSLVKQVLDPLTDTQEELDLIVW